MQDMKTNNDRVMTGTNNNNNNVSHINNINDNGNINSELNIFNQRNIFEAIAIHNLQASGLGGAHLLRPGQSIL